MIAAHIHANLQTGPRPSFTRFTPGLLIALAISLLLCTRSFAAEDLSGTVDFNIPAQSVQSALFRFSELTNVQVVVSSEVLTGKQSRAVSGTLAVRKALEMLLGGTELDFAVINPRTVAIRVTKTAGMESGAGEEKAWAQTVEEFRLARAESGSGPFPANVESDEQQGGHPADAEVTVIGSRIAGPRQVTAHPVTVITQKDIERAGISTLGDIVRLIPQLGAHNKTSGTGVSGRILDNPNAVPGPDNARTTANLRGLSNNTTLVLVDGRRLSRTGQASGGDNYDLSSIPLSAVDRIEVLSAGASAVYGADAIAGAINIILKEKFAGVDAGTTYDGTFDGGGAIRSINVAPGFTVGKLNGFASFSYLEQNQLKATDRWFTESDDKTSLGGSASLGLPGTAGSGSVGSAFPFLPLPGLTPPASQAAIPQGSNGMTATLADYQNAVLAPGIDNARYTNLIDPRRETAMMFRMGYDLAPTTELFVDGRWSERLHRDVRSPPIILQLNGLPAFISGGTYDQYLPAGYPGNPFDAPITVTKTLFDAPSEFTDRSSRLTDWAGTVGARGDLGSVLRGWRYEASTSWARGRLDANGFGFNANQPGFLALIHDPNPANRPNLLDDSTTGPASLTLEQLMAGAVSFPSSELSDTYVYGLQTNGPLFHLLAGAVKAAVGAEYTDEKVRFITVPGDTSFNSQVSDATRSVRSLAAEVSVPLAPEGHFPLLERLEAGAQARYDDYSFFDSKVSPGYSLLYSPANGVILRGSTSKGFKVPGLRDLYGPVSTGAVFAAPGPDAVIDPVTNLPITGLIQIFREPNPDLNPETSTSVNAGVVLDLGQAGLLPLRGLTVSVDHFDIDYTNLSSNPDLQDVVTFFPELLQRNSPTDPVTGFISRPVNFASLRAKGWDYRVTYDREMSLGDLAFQASYSRPDSTETRLSPTSAPVVRDAPDRGQASVFWTRGPFEAGINAHYQSTYIIGTGLTQRERASELGYDPQIAYTFSPAGGFNDNNPSGLMRLLANSRLSLTVFNAIYKKVSIEDAANNTWVLDPRLRRYSLSLKKSF